MDLGTPALRSYLRGKGIVFAEPSTVVFHRDGRTLDVEAYGHQAAPMVGKVPACMTDERRGWSIPMGMTATGSTL